MYVKKGNLKNNWSRMKNLQGSPNFCLLIGQEFGPHIGVWTAGGSPLTGGRQSSGASSEERNDST